MNTKQGYNLEINKNTDSQRNMEKALIERIANGDENALEQLYHNYYSRLLRFISRTTGRADRIEDVINEVMYVVWQKAKTYNQKCQPSTWIFGIAYNKARKSMQQSRFDQAESLDLMDSENTQFGRNNPELKQLELRNTLENAFYVLSPDQRTVIELTYYHGLHYDEIAQLMDCPENTVKTRMYHARKKLASILTKLDNHDFLSGEKQ
ncbi:MAG: sigma-70 family RNA polymerase sigma factor [Methylococcaceae bacterium]|nr:sigma-70 family RNA polymerase sigma factor [Methylococcaceae bacterium]